MAPRAPVSASQDVTSQRQPLKDDDEDARGDVLTLTLFHKARLCAGLLASEAVGVFSCLFILPLLQTLGTPVSLLTIPGVVSSSLALTLVPLLGCLADGGSHPQHRKKPIVVVAFLIALAGLSFILSGAILHAWRNPLSSAKGSPSALNATVTGSFIVNLSGVGFDSLGNEDEAWRGNPAVNYSGAAVFASPTAIAVGRSNASINAGAFHTFATSFAGSSEGFNQNATGITLSWEDVGQEGSADLKPRRQEAASDMEPSRPRESVLTEAPTSPSHPSQNQAVADSSFGFLGLPIPALLGMVGFVVIDVGFDVTNVAVKSYMLTHCGPADHVSLLVTGVFMSALGGVATSVAGLVDLATLLPDVNPVCSQVIVESATIIALCVLCGTCSLLSAPKRLATPTQRRSYEHLEEEGGVAGEGGDMGVATMTLQTEVQENMIMATTSPVEALMSTSTQVEHTLAGLSVSLGISYHYNTSTEDVTDTTPLLAHKTRLGSIPEEPRRESKNACCGGRTWKLFVIWMLVFFTACCLFTFNVIIADYLGKVVLGGDPEAEPESMEHALYEQGLRSAAMCTLILNLTYVLFSLCHNKVLAALGPKVEYMLVAVALTGMLLALRMTGNMIVAYVTSAVIGLNRTSLYTVPFMLANNLCQKEAESASSTKGEGHARVGSTMALITCALPCAYLVVSCIIGPLIDVTGDPSAPLLMGVVCSLLAAITVFGYRS